MPLPLTDVFADLPDPRRDLNKRHALVDILVIATCVVIGGAAGWDQGAEYGRRKKPFFQRFLVLATGIPSHDPFGRAFAALDPAAFAGRFARWMASACERTGLTPTAVDGKSARRSTRGTATGCLHLVSAWATANGVTLGRVSVADGSNEVAAARALVTVTDTTVVHTDPMCEWLRAVAARGLAGPVTRAPDHARDPPNAVAMASATESGSERRFLPGGAPNRNRVERRGRFAERTAVSGKDRPTCADFRAAAQAVPDGTTTTHADGSASLTTRNFREFENVALQAA